MLCCRSIFLHRCRCCITGVYSYIDVVVLQEYILTYMLLLYYRSIFLHRCRCCVAGVYSYIDVLVLQKYILTQMSLLCCRSINVQNYRSVTVAWSLAAVPCSDSLLQLIPPNPSNPNPSPPQITLPAQPPLPMSMQAVEMKKSCYTSQFETSLCQAHQPCTWKGSPSHLCAPDFCSSRVHVCVIRIKGKEKEKKNKKTTTTHCDKGHAEMGPFPFTLSDDGILFACTLS